MFSDAILVIGGVVERKQYLGMILCMVGTPLLICGCGWIAAGIGLAVIILGAMLLGGI